MTNRRLFTILTALLVLALISTTFAASAFGQSQFSSQAAPQKVKVLIGFKQQPGPNEQALVRSTGGEIRHSYHLIPAIAASVPSTAIAGLQHNPHVAYVEADGTVSAVEQVLPWGVDRVNADVVHDYDTGTGVKVGVIDTGIDLDHPDLTVAGNTTFVDGTTTGNDDNGHGTHVAGIIGARDNSIGVVGVAPDASLYAVKVLDSKGSGYESDVIAGIQWAVDNHMNVVNMSLGSSSASTAFQTACDNAYADGLVLVAAAGNSGNSSGRGDNVNYPARYDSVIAVAATDSSNLRASWSSTGPAVELAAPGVSIYSTYNNGTYATLSGTSMASPHVAGVAALVIASDPSLTNEEVRQRMDDTATDLGVSGRDTKYGYGLVNAALAAPNTTPPTPVHDVAVTGLTAPAQVGTGTLAQIDASVANEGAYAETFNVALTDTTAGTQIGSQQVTLDPGASQVLNFTWDTSSAGIGTHTLEAVAGQVTGETDVADNSLTTSVAVVDLKTMLLDVTTDLTSYSTGSVATITVTTTDSNGAVSGAAVHLQIVTASGKIYAYDGTTGTNGKATFSLKIKKPDGRGTYTATATGTKSGYDTATGSTTLSVN